MKRRTRPLVLVTVFACAVFAANAVAAIVEAQYLGPAARGVAPPPRPRAAPPPRAKPDPNLLVARNMFCSTCTELIPGPMDSFTPDAVLIAISQGFEPRATLRVPGSEVQGSWGVGEDIPGVGRIDRIGWVSIDVVDASARRATLTLRSAAGGEASAATHAPAAAEADPWAERVRKIDDHTFEVDRALVRELASGSTKPGAMRILPVSDNGVLTGLRLYGAQAGSLASELGLKNGDVLTAINNQPIKSVQTLIDLYAQLDQLNYVELAGTRAGKPMAIDLRLR